MTVTNRDSSLLTQKRAAKVVYSNYLANRTAVNAGAPISRAEQTSFQLQDIVNQRNSGACPYARETLRAKNDPSYVNYDYSDANVAISKPVNQ